MNTSNEDAEDILARVIPGRLIEPDPLSWPSLKCISTWFSRCEYDHMRCSGVFPMPTRILDIGDAESEQVYLRESGGQLGTYVALSHCWGRQQNFKATATTMPLLMAGISTVDLPKTFRDAIKITKLLGIRYLWIDSLCIRQGDVQDWDLESSRMGSVFRNAYLTIAASRATDDNAGFLGLRTLPDTLLVPYRELGQPMSSIYLAIDEYISRQTSKDLLEKEPLTQRAWALQERYLSRRTLFFGEKQMLWQCEETVDTEDGEGHIDRGYRIENILETALPPSVNSQCSSSPSALHSEPSETDVRTARSSLKWTLHHHNYTDWYAMVAKYSKCDITRGSDRLPALSGVAAVLAEAYDDSYCAGLWPRGMVEGLAWSKSLDHLVGDPSPSTVLLTKPAEYRAPSWSWASVDGVVDFWFFQRGNSHDIRRCEKLAHLRDYHVVPRGENPYGEVQAGWLRIEAPVQPIERLHGVVDRMFHRFGPYYQLLIVAIDEAKYLITASFDRPIEACQMTLRVLFLTQAPIKAAEGEKESYHACGLIIQPTATSPDEYERVGMVGGPLVPVAQGVEPDEAYKAGSTQARKGQAINSFDLKELPREPVILV